MTSGKRGMTVSSLIMSMRGGARPDTGCIIKMNKETLLKSSLEVAVPLWIEAFKNYDWAELKRVMSDSENVLSECAEGIIYRIEGKSAKAFNALAKAIAVLSYVPGGIEVFGMRFEANNDTT